MIQNHEQELSYYGLPTIKPPVWIWTVPLYLYLGSTAGALTALGAAAQAFDGHWMRNLVTRCRWLATSYIAVGTACLVYDLGRPERFLNMLRVFRPSSPMSVGSWLLAVTGSLIGAAALLSRANGSMRKIGHGFGYAAAVVGIPLAGYTGVLLSTTAVPIWQETRRSLPLLFVASGVAGAGALLSMSKLGHREEKAVHRFELIGQVAELACMGAVEREALAIKEVGNPLKQGPSGVLWTAAKTMVAAGLVLSILPGRSRRKQVAAGVLGTLGAITLRVALLQAGKASARNPQATFGQQRAGHGAAELGK